MTIPGTLFDIYESAKECPVSVDIVLVARYSDSRSRSSIAAEEVSTETNVFATATTSSYLRTQLILLLVQSLAPSRR